MPTARSGGWVTTKRDLDKAQAFGFIAAATISKSLPAPVPCATSRVFPPYSTWAMALFWFLQENGLFHAAKPTRLLIILTGTGRVHFFVVLAHQKSGALLGPPDPVPRLPADRLLFLKAARAVAFSMRRSFPSVSHGVRRHPRIFRCLKSCRRWHGWFLRRWCRLPHRCKIQKISP